MQFINDAQYSDNKLQLIKEKLHADNMLSFPELLKEVHQADIAEVLEETDQELCLKILLKNPPKDAAQVFQQFSLAQQKDLFLLFKGSDKLKYILEMETYNVTELLGDIQEKRPKLVDSIIKKLPPEKAESLRELLSYEDNTAASIMNPEFISIPENLNVEQALHHIKKQNPPEHEISFYVFVVNKQGQLFGYTTLRNLVISSPDTKIKQIRNDYPIKVLLDTDQEEVAKAFQKYELRILPVVDDQNVLQGIITVDDIVDVVVEEATEDIYKLSGTTEIDEEKLIDGSIIYPILSRLPWLLITIVGGIFASLIITLFSTTFEPNWFSLALVLSFMPLLMGLGGNVGNQSSTIMVRGMATGIVKRHHSRRYLKREITIGASIGFIIGIILYLYLMLSGQSMLFASIVCVSLFLNITTAALIGTALPIILDKLSIDPAIASAPFISTTLDIMGQIIYFSLTLGIIHLFV